MPIAPITVVLSDHQKVEVLKRYRKVYGDELTQIETRMTEILISIADADYLATFLGDQPEVTALRAHQAELATLETRRAYLGKIIDRLASVVPAQADVKPPPPSGAPVPSRNSGVVRRF